jgi:ribonuclease Z
MTARELVVLGTASQAPTRHRNHNGYFLRWDAEGFLFDPGEGTQRQLLLAGVAASGITRIFITHFHGDHCLGLPGVIQRLSLDRVAHPVDLYFPASGMPYLQHLRATSIFEGTVDLRLHPVEEGGPVDTTAALAISARALNHRVDAVGWRIEEPAGVQMLPERLEALGVRGPAVARLAAAGEIDVDGRPVRLGEVSRPRPGQSFAFVMDTAACEAAERLAEGVDLLVSESTFLAAEQDLATAWGHLTAGDAARIAAGAGAGALVLTHFSRRHPDEADYQREAGAIFPATVAAHDLMTIPFPPRRTVSGAGRSGR